MVIISKGSTYIPPTGFLPIVLQVPGLEMLQEHEFIRHKGTGEAVTCQLWNMVYFERSMFLRHIISFSISQRNSQDLQKPLKKDFKCFKSYPALCQARRGAEIEDFI